MKLGWKIGIAIIGSGLNGGLAFLSSQNPVWSIVCTSAVLAISGTMSILIGWPPKTNA